MKEMRVESIKIEEIIPYANNPRHNDEAVSAVAESIRAFGFKVPIVIDKDNVIVTGHTRLKAAKVLGMDEVPCIRADDLSEDEVKAFRLADNKVGEIATWDFELLDIELDDIEMDMSGFGFDDIVLGDMELDEIIEDDVPEPPKEPKAKLGDVYRLGDHVLMCGDSTDPETVEILMRGGSSV